MKTTIQFQGKLNGNTFWRFSEDKTFNKEFQGANWFQEERDVVGHNKPVFSPREKVEVDLQIIKSKSQFFYTVNRIKSIGNSLLQFTDNNEQRLLQNKLLKPRKSRKVFKSAIIRDSQPSRRYQLKKNKVQPFIRCKHDKVYHRCKFYSYYQKNRSGKGKEKVFRRNPHYYRIVQGGSMS